MSADEEGALVVGSGKWSGVGWAWGSTSKEPSKHASERMAAAGALVAEGKTAEKNEGSSSPGRRSGKRQGERGGERVVGGLWAMGKALNFYGRFMGSRVLGAVYSGGVGCGERSRRCMEREESMKQMERRVPTLTDRSEEQRAEA